jgi:hypothetical protein
MSEPFANIVPLEPTLALRDHFLGWQCRIRQHAMRKEEGRPSSGMQPRVTDQAGSLLAEAITVLIVPRDPSDTIHRFRHLARRTFDPAERYQKIVEILSETYFQHPRDFSDEMTGLFAAESQLASRLLEAERCVLTFSQFRQDYRLPCAISELAADQPAWQHTYWHNLLFNPTLPPAPRIFAFSPHWAEATADPAIA